MELICSVAKELYYRLESFYNAETIVQCGFHLQAIESIIHQLGIV